MESRGLINFVFRALQFLWALLIMALTGNMIADYYGGSPAVVNYAMFISVFSMLSLFFLIPATIKSEWGLLGFLPFTLDLLNTIFYLTGGIAFAAELHVHSCNNYGYLISNKITQGNSKTCREGQASTAFLWFGFAAFLGSTIITGLGMSGFGSSSSRGVRRGPAMSQV